MMPIRDVVIFPFMMTPFVVGRESSVRALEEAMAGDKKIFLATQHDASIDEPKPNEIYSVGAIVKQYQKLFEFENVRLRFSDEALEAIADLAMDRKVGARGLRMILEDLMLDLMYYLPSYKKVREFQVTREMVLAQKISLTLLEKAG